MELGSLFELVPHVDCEVAPEDSLYFWCYRQGLRGVKLDDVIASAAPRTLRQKDVRNYWAGWTNRALYRKTEGGGGPLFNLAYSKGGEEKPSRFQDLSLYRDNPIAGTRVDNRWVPCNAANKPMIKWGNGCMSYADARAYPGSVYLAENLKGTSTIVIDIDGDHDPENIDVEVLKEFDTWRNLTHCLYKDRYVEDGDRMFPVGYHLTFSTKLLIPTMHFPTAHVDVCGNMNNQLRYIKTKKWNGLDPMELDCSIWDQLKKFLERRSSC